MRVTKAHHYSKPKAEKPQGAQRPPPTNERLHDSVSKGVEGVRSWFVGLAILVEHHSQLLLLRRHVASIPITGRRCSHVRQIIIFPTYNRSYRSVSWDMCINHANPIDHHLESCTDHTDRTRSECNVLTDPGIRKNNIITTP